MSQGFAGLRVLDLSTQIAGGYCSKLLVDGGAEVIKVEPQGGDPLRRRSTELGKPGTEPAALFDYLHAGKRSVVGTTSDPRVGALIAEADLLIEAHGLEGDAGERLDVAALRAQHPSLVIVSITPYGLTGPWKDRSATEFTLQAESGSIGMRGLMGGEPFQAGGRIGEWAAGAFAAVAALPAVLQARATGKGEHVDVSMLETSNLIFTNFSETMNRLMNGSTADPEHAFLAPTVETPSIEPTADGYVGFCTNSRQQFSDFLLMIERTDLQEDEQLAQFAGRLMRFEEWTEIMGAWLRDKTIAEVIELASLLRIPVAPVCNGETVQQHEQLVDRGVFVPDAAGRFVQPRRPYCIDGVEPPKPRPAPALEAEPAPIAFTSPRVDALRGLGGEGRLPLEGLRILDLTAWWAGPFATHVLATFGAEVIRVESISRPDGLRMIGGMMASHYPQWWDAGPHFLQANTNKLDITLDLTTKEGLELLEQLVGECDAVVENFTPRVIENFGLTWDRVREINPKAVMMRMPAFGLSGPWRDHTGFAQTMEQMSGMAWVTGHADDQPRIPRGPCDPIAGMHATVAFLVALCSARAEGTGHHVESTMVESALNVAAEQVVEWSAHRRLMQRDGNRSGLAAPQGLYACAEKEPLVVERLALSVATDAQWRALRALLGEPAWAMDPGLDTLDGRRAAHDEIDRHLIAWCARQDREALVETLRAAGITASAVANPCRLLETNPQLVARRYFETPDHPVVGPMPLPSLPCRYADIEHWIRTPAPSLGQHNERVLGGLLGVSDERLAELEEMGVIGTRPEGL